MIEESFEVLSLQLAPCHEGRKFANYLILAEPTITRKQGIVSYSKIKVSEGKRVVAKMLDI